MNPGGRAPAQRWCSPGADCSGNSQGGVQTTDSRDSYCRGMPDATPASTGFRLLVVDDEPDIVELLSASLRFAGFDVAPAASGKQALDAGLARFRPDLILLDVMMPGIDGFDGAVRGCAATGTRCRCCSSPPATPPRTRSAG